MNFEEYRIKWEDAKKGELNLVPLHLDIELTSKCNISCKFCAHSNYFQDTGNMTNRLADSIVQQAIMLKVPSLKFNMRGEPTLYNNLPYLIKKAKKGGVLEIQINTNGNSKLEVLKDIVDAGIDRIIFSFDVGKEEYESIRTGAKYERVQHNIRGVVNYIRYVRSNCKIRVQTVDNTLNHSKIDLFKKEYEGIGCEVRIATMTVRGGKDKTLGVTCNGIRSNCGQPFQRLGILYDGRVVACCSDAWSNLYLVGDATQESLFQIWHSEKVNKLRNGLKNLQHSEFGHCSNCSCTDSWKGK